MEKQTITPAQCRAARSYLDWSQEQLAEKVGLSKKTITNFEKNGVILKKINMDKIHTVFEENKVLIRRSKEGVTYIIFKE